MIIKIKDDKKHVIFFSKENIFSGQNPSKKAIFFDRDGVLIKDMHYIKDPKDVILMNGVNDLLKHTKKLRM